MSSTRFVVVAEAGLSANQYGAAIVTSEPMDSASADAFVKDILAGRRTDFVDLGSNLRVLKVPGLDQFLVVEVRRGQPDRLTRITVAEMAA